MKLTKKLIVTVLTLALALGCVPCTTTEVQAATIYVPNNQRCGVGPRYYSNADIYLASSSNVIKNIKTYSGKRRTQNLVVKQTYKYKYKEASRPYLRLTFYAKKTGTYRITFDIYKDSKAKKKMTSRTIKIHASTFGSIVSKVNLNGKSIIGKNPSNRSTYYTSLSSARVKFSLAKGCRIRGIKVVKRDQNGNDRTYGFSNGRKVSLGRYGVFSDDDYSWSRGMWASTTFKITYRDSYAQDTTKNYTTEYTLYRRATKW